MEGSGNPGYILLLVSGSSLPVGKGQASDGGETSQVMLNIELLFCGVGFCCIIHV